MNPTRSQRRAQERQQKKLIQKRDALRLRAQKALHRQDEAELKAVHQDLERFKKKYYAGADLRVRPTPE